MQCIWCPAKTDIRCLISQPHALTVTETTHEENRSCDLLASFVTLLMADIILDKMLLFAENKCYRKLRSPFLSPVKTVLTENSRDFVMGSKRFLSMLKQSWGAPGSLALYTL